MDPRLRWDEGVDGGSLKNYLSCVILNLLVRQSFSESGFQDQVKNRKSSLYCRIKFYNKKIPNGSPPPLG